MGVFFATSTDGYHWTPANSGKPWFPVEQPGELMRDPRIVGTGYRSVSACYAGVIAYRLGRKVKWDAKPQTFPGDAEAQAMMTNKYGPPYLLPVV